jgi:DNA-binding CsgD family transcriptional regulator
MTGHGHCDRRCACGGSHVTLRQAEVLALVATGLTVDQAARRLGIATTTAEDHLRSMRQRTRTHTCTELVARAFVAGIFKPASWPPTLTGRLCVPRC